MAKKKAAVEVPQILQNWWADALLGLAFLAIAYGFASWAINSGSLIQYAAAILFFIYAIKSFVMAARRIFKH